MVGFDYQSVLIGTYFEKKGFSIVYADFYFQHLKSQDQREKTGIRLFMQKHAHAHLYISSLLRGPELRIVKIKATQAFIGKRIMIVVLCFLYQ